MTTYIFFKSQQDDYKLGVLEDDWGYRIFTTLRKNGPAEWMQSDRNVPEFKIARSALVAATCKILFIN